MLTRFLLLICRTGCLISGRAFLSKKFRSGSHRHRWHASPILKVFPVPLFLAGV